MGTQPPVAQTGHTVQTSQTQAIWGDPLSVGFASHTQRCCSKEMPWWGGSFRSGVHARSHVWPVLLASHGCSGKGIHQKMPTMPCHKAKQPKAPLENIVVTHPLELVHLDYHCLEPGEGLEENVLVVTDHFTRYAQAYVTRTQTAQTTARNL